MNPIYHPWDGPCLFTCHELGDFFMDGMFMVNITYIIYMYTCMVNSTFKETQNQKPPPCFFQKKNEFP